MFLEVLIYGFLAGIYAAVWGVLQDTPHERFRFDSFIRSPILGIFSSLLLLLFISFQPQVYITSAVVYFFVCAGLERFFTETYKLFFRQESQDKYKIPQRFAIYGSQIKSAFTRAFLGVFLIISIFVFIFWWRSFINNLGVSKYVGAAMAASVGGILASLGGANKDAPKEGFNRLLLFRSEIVAVLCGLLFVSLTNDLIIIGWAAIGAERTVIEFYKTFIRRRKPGKFR